MGGWKDGWMSGTDTRSVKQIINTISADNDYTKVAGPSHSSSRPPLAFTAPGLCVRTRKDFLSFQARVNAHGRGERGRRVGATRKGKERILFDMRRSVLGNLLHVLRRRIVEMSLKM